MEKKLTLLELANDLNVGKNKIEFINDLNLFFDIIAFRESNKSYLNILKDDFSKYMKEWDININDKFLDISKCVRSSKLPFKIIKDEGIENIKSDKFLLLMLIELYVLNLVAKNNYINKFDLISFIHIQFNKSGINIDKKNIFIRDIDYLFKNEKIYNVCKLRISELQIELYYAYNKLKNEVEKRNKINLNLSFNINVKNVDEDLNLKIKQLQDEIRDLKQNKAIELEEEMNYKVMTNLLKLMNDENNGNLMDRLYRYSKGYEDENLKFLVNNLFNVFKQMGIYPRESTKIGSSVDIEEYSFYNYRLNKDISDINKCEGEVIYPAWFYKNKEIMKPYVNIRGEIT